MRDILISDFNNKHFQKAFKIYFQELGIHINDWDKLFQNINAIDDNYAYLRLTNLDEIVGFIQFSKTELSSWFFNSPVGFICEFWVSKKYRGSGNGQQLLELAEDYFKENNLLKCILTTDTASDFYRKFGYEKDSTIFAKNENDVFVKLF